MIDSIRPSIKFHNDDCGDCKGGSLPILDISGAIEYTPGFSVYRKHTHID